MGNMLGCNINNARTILFPVTHTVQLRTKNASITGQISLSTQNNSKPDQLLDVILTQFGIKANKELYQLRYTTVSLVEPNALQFDFLQDTRLEELIMDDRVSFIVVEKTAAQ